MSLPPTRGLGAAPDDHLWVLERELAAHSGARSNSADTSLQEGTWYAIPAKPSAQEIQEHEGGRIYDLVKYATAAHRQFRGNIMWTCWQPCGAGQKPTRVSHPRSGSMLLMLSVTGAGLLKQAFAKRQIQQGHFDVALLRWLQDNVEFASAAYLLPPMGNYTAHISGCEPAYSAEARPSCWKEKWVCQGTRVAEDPKRRTKYWCGFTKMGQAEYLTVVVVDDSDALVWRMHRPGQEGEWGGGPQPVQTSTTTSSSSAVSLGCTPVASVAPPPEMTNRQKRARRSNILGRCRFRYFTDKVHEAGNKHRARHISLGTQARHISRKW